jgi:small conductance mechanosensitive channel
MLFRSVSPQLHLTFAACVFSTLLAGNLPAVGQVILAPAAKSPSDEKSAAENAAPQKSSPAKPAAEKHNDPPRDTWDLISLGLRVAGILATVFIILWAANRLHGRLVRLLAGTPPRGSALEQENRARTLVGVLHNALRTIVIALGAIMVLDTFGIPVTALLGGVAVVGLAVAFGAQSLIKDYFTGFLVLLEQQYLIGDVVKVGNITGQVEKITLRVTVLRDLEGAVHFVPHGQINVVSNLTHGWSQAVFDLNVASSEHVERVRDTFFELARELRGDPTFGPMILNDAHMLGVDSLGDSTFTLKFLLRTLPLKRWEVKRELLRRIKSRFQELNIKVVVPA